MKYIWILILVIFSSCNREDDQPFELTAEGLIGTWEHYQSQGNTGGGDYWTPYEASGRTITFFSRVESLALSTISVVLKVSSLSRIKVLLFSLIVERKYLT